MYARLSRVIFVALLVAGLALAAVPAFAATQTIVPYTAEGYKYLEIGYNATPPTGFTEADFDDAAWGTGAGGFGLANFGGCTAQILDSGTPWDLNSQMLVRKTFELPARTTNVKVGVAIDNDVRVWVNGHDVSGGLRLREGCPAHDDFVFTVSEDYIIPGGENVLAVQAFDRGILAYLDIQVTADVPPPYAWSGFLPPIDSSSVNVVKAGSAVPVKFSLGGDQGLDIFALGSPFSARVACDSGDPLNDVQETVTTGGSSLTYDPAADQYTYVWKTDKTWAGACRQLSVSLNDETVHVAEFRFK